SFNVVFISSFAAMMSLDFICSFTWRPGTVNVSAASSGSLCTHTGRLQGTDYLCELGGGLCVDARQYCSEAAFINHFCGIAGAPNCEIEGVPAERVILIRTTRDIPRGEELLVDYGPSYCLESGVPHPRVPDWAREFARHPY
ncbi:unnamed protein product, partial [Prorocentrum cordatum]